MRGWLRLSQPQPSAPLRPRTSEGVKSRRSKSLLVSLRQMLLIKDAHLWVAHFHSYDSRKSKSTLFGGTDSCQILEEPHFILFFTQCKPSNRIPRSSSRICTKTTTADTRHILCTPHPGCCLLFSREFCKKPVSAGKEMHSKALFKTAKESLLITTQHCF